MSVAPEPFPNEVLRALRLGELGPVEEWLRDHDVNRADGGGFTLLLHAARYMAISETAKNVIGYLIERGADVSQSDGGLNSYTALHYVASAHKIPGAIDAARLLLAAGAPINEQTAATKRTPLGAVVHSLLCSPFEGAGVYIRPESVDLIALLVRNGAALDRCCGYETNKPTVDVEEDEDIDDWEDKDPGRSYDLSAEAMLESASTTNLGAYHRFVTGDDEARYLEVKALFTHTRRLRDRYTILRMRSLALRGRATTTDEVMKFLVLRANHLVAKVYAFLPAQLGVK